MAKMMVDYKKAEICGMRHNLTFRNENELQLLDNQLDSIDYHSMTLASNNSVANN